MRVPTIEKLSPRDRRSWLKARGQDVTASVVGALFGVHDFQTPYGLWCLKKGLTREDPTETAPMRRGRLLEPVAVQMIREDRPDWDIHHNAANEYWRDPAARLGATPDTLVQCPKRGLGTVQIKTVQESVYRRKWLDEDGNPEAPLWIALQATLEAHLIGAKWAAVAPLVVGHGIECPLIPIDLMPGVVDAIYLEADAFWASIAADEPPPQDYDRDASIIDAMHAYGDPGEEIDLSADNRIPELLSEVATAKADRKAADVRKAAAEAEIKAKLGDAVVAHIGQGRRITWRMRKRAAFSAPATSFRVLTLPDPQ